MSARYLLSAVSAAALIGMAVPALSADVEAAPEAPSAVSAQLEAWLGYMFIDEGDVDFDETDFFAFGIDGKLRVDLFEGLSVQADASYDEGKDDYRGYQNGVLLGGHLSWSDPDSFLVGAFGAWSDGDQRFSETYDAWAVGGEVQIYLDALTLYGQFGYMDGRRTDSSGFAEDDAFHNAYFGRAVGRYFLSPETRLQAEFLYASGDQDNVDHNMDVFGWGARADHQIYEMMSVFVAYNGHDYDVDDDSDGGSYTEHVVRGGISLNFGRPDLLSVDRTGPNLDLPQIGHWAAAGDVID